MVMSSQHQSFKKVLLINKQYMYRRFLNNKDYLSVITKEALMQLTRNDDDRFAQAEEAAEMSIREYLSENYEIEQEDTVQNIV